jgi:hypothetical protein
MMPFIDPSLSVARVTGVSSRDDPVDSLPNTTPVTVPRLVSIVIWPSTIPVKNSGVLSAFSAAAPRPAASAANPRSVRVTVTVHELIEVDTAIKVVGGQQPGARVESNGSRPVERWNRMSSMDVAGWRRMTTAG